ncbi:MAG: lipid-A-disaccharide synthase [Bacteroidia bacterium]
MRYYIISGEASGDLHASNLVRELRLLDADAKIQGWGGDLMEQQGVKLVKHYRDLAFMGFAEVLFNLRTILKNIDFCKKDLLAYKPDVLILVDYPGFNLRIAKFAHEHGIKVFYYISPSVWAWKESRVKLIKEAVDKMFVILPFEKPFYAKHNYVVDYAGHPLLDAIEQKKIEFTTREQFIQQNKLNDKPLIAILPGSRKQEISAMLPVMMNVAKQFPQFQFIIAGSPGLPESYYQQYLSGSDLRIIFGKTHEILHHSYAGLIKSGTSTLEAALYDVPQVVCYKGNAVSIWIAKRLANVKYFSLVNLIMDKPVVKELLQEEMNEETLKAEFTKIRSETGERKAMLKDYEQLRQDLGNSGASKRLAALMYGYLKNKN